MSITNVKVNLTYECTCFITLNITLVNECPRIRYKTKIHRYEAMGPHILKIYVVIYALTFILHISTVHASIVRPRVSPLSHTVTRVNFKPTIDLYKT